MLEIIWEKKPMCPSEVAAFLEGSIDLSTYATAALAIEFLLLMV